METITEGFKKFMKEVWPAISAESRQYKVCRNVFFASVLWTLGTLSESIKSGEKKPVDVLRKQLEDFLKQLDKEKAIREDILKAWMGE